VLKSTVNRNLTTGLLVSGPMDTNTLIIIIVVVLLLGGGGFFFRGRR
jgi:LPXTG-motif cell wall-anchored protein